SGPAAGLAVIVLVAIKELGSFEAFLLAVVISGALQAGFGFLKAGIVAYYFPSSVIKGMLSGIGIIIFLKQLPYAFGFSENTSLAASETANTGLLANVQPLLTAIAPGVVIISL